MDRLIDLLKDKVQNRSLRAVARDLGVPAPTLSRILSGRRKLTEAMKRRLILAVAKDPGERRRLLEVAFVRPEGRARRPTRYRKLSPQELKQLGNWHFLAVADALGIRPRLRSVGQIAEVCGLSLSEVEECLTRMKNLSLVRYKVGQGYEMVDAHLSTLGAEGTPEWASLQWGMVDRLRQLHPMGDPERAVLRGILFRTLPENLPEIRARIQAFMEDIADEFAEPESTSMVRMNLQFGRLA
jgi:hypothetical protein